MAEGVGGGGAVVKGVPLPVALLYRPCDPTRLPVADTVPTGLMALPGQQRAIEALAFGLGIQRRGYNVFVFGRTGSGRHAFVLDRLQQQAVAEPTPPDWCYVNNFEEPRRPHVIALPSGRGEALRDAMRRLVEELLVVLPGVFERDEFRAQREKLDERLKQQHEVAFGDLARRAEECNIAMVRTPVGFSLVPTHHGVPLDPEQVERMPESERNRIQADIDRLHNDLEAILRQVPDWERDHRSAVRELVRETAGQAIERLIEEVRAAHPDVDALKVYLQQVEQDVREHVDEFLAAGKARAEQTMAARLDLDELSLFRRYRVNVATRNTPGSGAPVVYEDHPTYQRLQGHIEHIAEHGALLTDFNLIVPGALHRANGGYLVVDAERLLMNHFSWDALKRAIRSEHLRLESIEDLLSVGSTISLEPDAIPLKVTVVLIGSPFVYFLLAALDPDLNELFKVAAELEPDLPRDDASEAEYARLLVAVARRDGLRALEPTGIARLIEFAARQAGDAGRLSTSTGTVFDLLQEADFCAAQSLSERIDAQAVQAAIDARLRRAEHLPQRMRDAIVDNTLRVETQGAQVGQINGLSVFAVGNINFGMPSRITASVRIGRGEVIDIERQVHLGGPLHTKGVMILTGFLGSRFGREQRLSLAASLVFEQSYGEVEGDSASAAELFALLSALADVPIRQSLGVTGSVDQRGQIQAIGGVNDKIEGFFDVCQARGLTGEQGVLIPLANVRHLMLRADVVAAVAAGRFSIYAIDTVDEGLQLLTGISAGQPQADGSYPEGGLNRLIADQLQRFSATARDESGNDKPD